jgi:hypothetical protein
MSATAIDLTGRDSDAELKEIAWAMFCTAHPHEANAHDPEGFWRVFHDKCPGVSREQMLTLLKDTEERPE